MTASFSSALSGFEKEDKLRGDACRNVTNPVQLDLGAVHQYELYLLHEKKLSQTSVS